MTTKPNEQPAPRPGGRPVIPVVLHRIRRMAVMGHVPLEVGCMAETAIIERDEWGSRPVEDGGYGCSLHTDNGRDPVEDACQELADATNYLVQAQIEKRDLRRIRAWLMVLNELVGEEKEECACPEWGEGHLAGCPVGERATNEIERLQKPEPTIIRDRRPTREEADSMPSAARFLGRTGRGLHVWDVDIDDDDLIVLVRPDDNGDVDRIETAADGRSAPGEIWRPIGPDGEGLRLEVR